MELGSHPTSGQEMSLNLPTSRSHHCGREGRMEYMCLNKTIIDSNEKQILKLGASSLGRVLCPASARSLDVTPRLGSWCALHRSFDAPFCAHTRYGAVYPAHRCGASVDLCRSPALLILLIRSPPSSHMNSHSSPGFGACYTLHYNFCAKKSFSKI